MEISLSGNSERLNESREQNQKIGLKNPIAMKLRPRPPHRMEDQC